MLQKGSRSSILRQQLCVLLAVALLLFNGLAPALAAACRERAMIVFDASGSMSSLHLGRSRIGLAREALGGVLPEITKHRATGLITFGGHGPPCADVILKIPPAVGSSSRIMSALEVLRPMGATEIESSVDLAARTLAPEDATGIIVLVTDGLELCGRDVCSLADRLRTKFRGLRVHVIGFHIRERAIRSLTCLVEATGGTYSQTTSVVGLRQALRLVLGCPRLSHVASFSTARG